MAKIKLTTLISNTLADSSKEINSKDFNHLYSSIMGSDLRIKHHTPDPDKQTKVRYVEKTKRFNFRTAIL